ncbi:MAG: dihydrofolate reductase family protein [Myxococcota bacterium]
MDPSRVQTPADLEELVHNLYGEILGPIAGTAHVVAATASSGAELSVMKIDASTPKSDHDFFALQLSRVRADAIVVTGGILRAEPNLRYDLEGSPDFVRALTAYRDTRCGHQTPPVLVILTRGRVPDAHPVWESWARPLVFTSDHGATNLAGKLPSRVSVVGVEEPSVRSALAHLARIGCRSISVEAGPSTAASLYDPLALDEVLLSTFAGPLSPSQRAGTIPNPERHTALRRVSSQEREEPSGTWSFRRYRRTSRDEASA